MIDERSSDVGASGVASGRTLDSLSDAEKRKVCDWMAASLGGYGTRTSCGSGGSIGAPDDAADCVRGMPECALKVAELEACIEAWTSSDLCSFDFLNHPACKALDRCEDEPTEPAAPAPAPVDEDAGAFSPAPDEIP